MFVRHGLGDERTDRLTQYARALHNIAQSIAVADKAGQVAAAEQLRAQWRALNVEYQKLGGEQLKAEMPSALALKIANFGEGFATNLRNVALIGAVGIGVVLLLPVLLSRGRR